MPTSCCHPIGAHRSLRLPDTYVSSLMLDRAIDAIERRVKTIDRAHDIPYLAGYSLDGKTIYIDRHLPRSFDYKGRAIAVDRYLLLHEEVEKTLIDQLDLHYQHAHQIATRAEEAAVRADGVSWRAYDRFMQKFVKVAGDERLTRLPRDLDLKPYRDEHDFELIRRMNDAVRIAGHPLAADAALARRLGKALHAHAELSGAPPGVDAARIPTQEVDMASGSRAGAPIRTASGLIADAEPDASGVRAFRGIPYAAPPVGRLRWRAPEPPARREGVYVADLFGPRAIQSRRLGDLDPLNDRMSEDCLYLNVWTPARAADERLPTMVWIHGGSNSIGAASQPEYDGANLARKGVVIVSINYRLDVFGFLAHPELTAESGDRSSGNYGLLDQITALRWTRENIAAFGGDPDNVTVFGESAGAFDISLLMASPLTEGLFARAIGQSGGAMSRSSLTGPKPLDIGEREGLDFARRLGVERIAALRALPAETLLAAAIANPISCGFGVIDGYVAPEHPADIFAAGRQRPVPLLVGANRDEGTLFEPRLASWGPGQPSFVERIRAQFGAQAGQALAHYPPGATPAEDQAAYARLVGDQFIDLGAWRWAELAAASGRAPVYRYLFDRRPPGAPEMSVYPLTAPGVYHFAEICYVFDNQHLRDWRWEAADRRLAQAMTSYWINFARAGDPNGEGLPHWPGYAAGGSGQLMRLAAEIEARGEAPAERARLAFLEALQREAAQR